MSKKIDSFLESDNKKSIENKITERQFTLDRFQDSLQSEEDDWTFKKAKTTELTHTIFNNYPARMIPQIAQKLIELYYPKYHDLSKKKPILDPFAGSGTTCVEALINDLDSIGVDLNPLAILITKVRTSIIPPKELDLKYKEFKQLLSENKNRKFETYFPDDPNLEYWYSKVVLRKLSVLSHTITKLFENKNKKLNNETKKIKNLFILCLSKTGRDCSYQRSGEHKSYRIPKKKLNDFDRNADPIKFFHDTFKKYAFALKEMYNLYHSNNLKSRCETRLENAMMLKSIKKNSIDLIVTSPPYGDSHTTVAYGQFSRFPLEWAGFKYKEIRSIDSNLLGGIKRDVPLDDSPLLLNIAKKILCEEIKEQNQASKDFLDDFQTIINSTDLDDEELIKSEFEDCINQNFIIDENRIENFNLFEDLLEFKQNFHEKLKKTRTEISHLKRKIRSKISNVKLPHPKILEERLPFVLSFFSDLYIVLKNLYDVLDYDRKSCIVIGNRTVKRIKIPTDEIIIEVGRLIGFKHIKSFYREIPNKRMPTKNAPSNIKGRILSTMNEEIIIVLNKPKQ